MTTKRTSREPTQEMLDAGQLAALAGAWVDQVWRAMHDAAPEAADPEMEKLREDAARYRWLRRSGGDERVLVSYDWFPESFLLMDEKLDAAIDAAIRKGEA